MTIPDHVIDAALAEANKKLREVSERISNEVAQMTKFKVGDKVTLYGEVVEVSNADVRHGISVLLDGRDDREDGDEYPVYVNESEISYVKKGHVTDVTFRDQAAIAALQAALAEPCSNERSLQGIAEYAFDLADALDAERKKRDGGE